MTTKSARLAAIYARVSTEEQAKGQIASTDTQVARCEEKARSLGLPVAPETSGLIVREQHSGGDLRWRGSQFMGLVERAERHEFTDLICLDLDRFCRGGADAYGEQKGLLIHAGVTVHYVMTDFGTTNPFHGGMEALMADAAQWLRDKSREASVRNRAEWARQGNIVAGNRAPFGFRFVYDETRHTRSNRRVIVRLEPDDETGPVLLHITEHVANGGSIKAIKAWLEAQHIPTPRGAPVWLESTIRGILHNPTNYGARRSFRTRVVERENAARRPKELKTKHRQVLTEWGEQFPVADERIVAIPGLTHDLWARAINRLAENKAFSARHATATDEERAARGLLFGGLVRCGVCQTHPPRALRLKAARLPNWYYYCSHNATKWEGTAPVKIPTRALDEKLWQTAVAMLRDRAFFERLLAETDAANGPAIRAASLRQQLTGAETAYTRLMTQLERLSPDDDLVADYQAKLRQNKSSRNELALALEAVEKEAAAEDARRATLAAFSAYATEQATDLDAKTPIERRNILRALRVRVRVGRGDNWRRVTLSFNIRGLPGARQALGEPIWDPEWEQEARQEQWNWEHGIRQYPVEIDASEPLVVFTNDDYEPDLEIVGLDDELDNANDAHDRVSEGQGDQTGAVLDARSSR